MKRIKVCQNSNKSFNKKGLILLLWRKEWETEVDLNHYNKLRAKDKFKMTWWIKINKVQLKLEIESDKLPEVEAKVIKDNTLKPKLKVKKILINLVKYGEHRIKKAKAIGL